MKLEEIYDLVGDRIFHYLAIKLGSQTDAEDVLQEVFYRLARYSLRLRLVKNLNAFAFKIARNEANRLLMKKAKSRHSQREKAELDEVIGDVISGRTSEDEEDLSRALVNLPEEQREVIVLKFFEELTFKEISEVCGISIHTAASRYRYGMEKLRLILE